MFISNLENKQLLKDSLDINLSEAQIQNCVLDNLLFENHPWTTVSINNCNANETVFHNQSLNDVTFFRSNLMNTKFINCKLNAANFSGDTLIKTDWQNCRIQNMTLANCSMQKFTMDKVIISDSSFTNFEGIYCSINNIVFNNCKFDINYDSGMNGFSLGIMKNCIFNNCNFTGYPLRGIQTDSCAFINCYGEITDDAQCKNTTGLSKFSACENMILNNKENALSFINNWK